jgi:hypothetical protein
MNMLGLGRVKGSPMEHRDMIINFVGKRIAEADKRPQQRRRGAD